MAENEVECPKQEGCPLGLTGGKVALMEEHVSKLMKTVYGDGNGNEGLQPLAQRREAQMALLLYVFGPSSILGLIFAFITLILQARH